MTKKMLEQKVRELYEEIAIRRALVKKSVENSPTVGGKMAFSSIANEQAEIMDMIVDILEPKNISKTGIVKPKSLI